MNSASIVGVNNNYIAVPPIPKDDIVKPLPVLSQAVLQKICEKISECGIYVDICSDFNNSQRDCNGVYVIFGLNKNYVKQISDLQRDYDNSANVSGSKNCTAIANICNNQTGEDAFLFPAAQVYKIENTSTSLFSLLKDVARMDFVKHFIDYAKAEIPGEKTTYKDKILRYNLPIPKTFIDLAVDYYYESINQNYDMNLRNDYYERAGEAMKQAFGVDIKPFEKQDLKRGETGKVKYLNKEPFRSNADFVKDSLFECSRSFTPLISQVPVKINQFEKFIEYLKNTDVLIYIDPTVYTKADFGEITINGKKQKSNADSFAYQMVAFDAKNVNTTRTIYGVWQALFLPELFDHTPTADLATMENEKGNFYGTKLAHNHAKLVVEMLENYNNNNPSNKVEWYYDIKGTNNLPPDHNSVGLFVFGEKDRRIFTDIISKTAFYSVEHFPYIIPEDRFLQNQPRESTSSLAFGSSPEIGNQDSPCL